MDDNKRPLILFSGGVDSTFLLWRTVTIDKKSCDVIYADGGQGPIKTKAEKEARRLIRAWLHEHRAADHGRISEQTVQSKTYVGEQGGGFRQALGWLVAAMEAFNPNRHSVVQVAYIAGDQINPHLYCLETAWDYLLPVCKNIKEKVDLTFPLKFHTKMQFLMTMPHELYRLTWVCENPSEVEEKFQPCDECPACKNRQVEAFRYKLETGATLPQSVWEEKTVT